MKIRILTSCTGEKRWKPDDQLTQDDLRLMRSDPATFAARDAGLGDCRAAAVAMYTGQQHVRLMRGVDACRGTELDCEVSILSAGYGLILGDREIVPYEVTFQGMRKGQLQEWTDHLQIPVAARQWFATPADLNLILLGESYLAAMGLDSDVAFAAPTLFFSGKGGVKLIKGNGPHRVVVLSNPEAKRFSCGLVALKGQLAAQVLAQIADDVVFAVKAMEPETDVLDLLDGGREAPKPAPEKKATETRVNPNVDVVIQIPKSWWDKPHRTKLRYFIPEWDDLVDPDYDFLNDEHSGGRGNWSNEVYAHQMYPEPNYDGILMSRAVVGKSKKKTKRIEAMGVHRYIRMPREFPVMGDCGAFDYIMEDVPPYSTEDVLDYYTRLDFDYGVSVDHLIVKATMEQAQRRYELTIHNAEEFLSEHRNLGLAWTPVGAVQGWDPASYADAAEQYVAMGYDSIALGGLVRSSTPGILKILEKVHDVVPSRVGVHLFGLARLDGMDAFANLGVTSVDSASFLRQAWIGAKDNYWTLDNQSYAAIRIPQVGTSFRAKRMISEGRADLAKVARLEAESLKAVRGFDQGKRSVDDVVEILSEYDHLVTPDRRSMGEHYRQTLEATPWKECPCEVCRKDGVEVIIFRGNNRNRRRGFHNTYCFYRLLQQVLNGEQLPERLRPKMSKRKEDDRQLRLF